ncbi:MAG TPA: bacillithiol biosynthesis cysteine-adding enzyme BshC [Chitinophagaceae bacterium]|nr:bacillithiol biosynthesis cysteine-adding enzyme BshC [Chitinophagaceae bacterium]
MECTSTRLPYRQTGAFSKIALDYIDQDTALRPFFSHPPSLRGLEQAINERKKFPTNRKVLVDVLQKQYAATTVTAATQKNIDALLSVNTFTITTAHQNNIFTGPLYFIYKILHVIKLSTTLNESYPGQHFVPVFYMGTEDADLEELNHIYLGDEKLEWNTKQTGAVGRMKIDKDLVALIDRMEGQLVVEPNGKEIISLIRKYYTIGKELQIATFQFVNDLFGEYGLVVLLPDNAELKRQMRTVFQDDLLQQVASEIVEKSAASLDLAGYKVQANPREINLFYLEDGIRERIVEKNDHYSTVSGKYVFSREEMLTELERHPEKFSPNVILRGIYQETILPNISFVGGGGETAYWLQLKDLFEHYSVPFPVLVLRNSFLVVEKKWQERIAKLGFEVEDFFNDEQELMNRLVMKASANDTKLNGSLSTLDELYESFKKQAAAVDVTLGKHVDALRLKTVHRLQELEKKMLRAEKRKFSDQQRQIQAIRKELFPGSGLQERHDNISYYYAKWGREFIQILYQNSLSLEQEFVILQVV